MLSELYIFFMSPHIGRFWSFSVCFPLTLGSLGWSYHVALRWSNLKMKNQQENNANLDKFSESSILIIPIFKLDYWRVYHFDWREKHRFPEHLYVQFQRVFDPNRTTLVVVLTILKHISQWEGLSHILWKIQNVPNHQPEQVTIKYGLLGIGFTMIYPPWFYLTIRCSIQFSPLAISDNPTLMMCFLCCWTLEIFQLMSTPDWFKINTPVAVKKLQ